MSGIGPLRQFRRQLDVHEQKVPALRESVVSVLADRILIETDSPYLTPEPLRGKQKRNEPALVAHTAAALAALRGVLLEEFERQTTGNARRLFKLNHEIRETPK